MNLPIVFLHRGNQDFIQYSLLKATETNPDSKVYLIGDNSNRHLGSLSGNIEWVDYGDCVSENSKLLSQSYYHMSTNPPGYEFICIDRWFVINEFMKKRNALVFCF